jgi:hypothetical protein
VSRRGEHEEHQRDLDAEEQLTVASPPTGDSFRRWITDATARSGEMKRREIHRAGVDLGQLDRKTSASAA